MQQTSFLLTITLLGAAAAGPVAGQTAEELADRIISQSTLAQGAPEDAQEEIISAPERFSFSATPEPELSGALLTVRRVFVDELTGDNTADQIRDLIIASLHDTGLFVVTENEARADAFLRGAAEDLIYTDQFQSGEGVDLRTSGSISTPGETRGTDRSAFAIALGDDESVNIRERRHEALASVRLVNLDGDVIWSTTQESKGAKFKGASADVAFKVARQLISDYEKAVQSRPSTLLPAR